MDSQQKKVRPRVKWTIVVIAVLIILNTLWLNIAYRHQLFLMSLNFIIEYQSHGNGFTQFVYNLFSFISGTEFTIAILILIILLPFRKANSYILVMFVAINTYVMAILKIAFIDPRPSWYTDQIHQLQWKCEYTYGFPSGHCWIILILHEIIWCDIIGTGPYHIFLLEPLIFAVIVPLSRLYLGSHTGDHIISSLTYGFAIAILYKYRIQQLLFRLFAFFLKPANKLKSFWIALTLQILLLMPPIVLYEVNTSQNRLGNYFLSRLNQICEEHYSLEHIEGRQASQSSIGNAVVGILYGLILMAREEFSKSDGKKLRIRFYFVGKWNFGQKKIRNFIFTMLLYIIPGGVILAIFIFVIPSFIQNFYGDYFCMSFGWIILLIYFVRFIPQIAFKLGLISEDIEEISRSQQRVPQVEQTPQRQNINSDSTSSKGEQKQKKQKNQVKYF